MRVMTKADSGVGVHDAAGSAIALPLPVPTRLRLFTMCCAAGLGLLSCAGDSVTAGADYLGGTVKTREGLPLAGAMVTLERPDLGATTVTVFSRADGRFRFPSMPTVKGVTADQIRVQKIGYGKAIQSLSASPDGIEIDCRMEAQNNVADQVPPAAWLRKVPAGVGGDLIRQQCLACHEFPAEKVKTFAMALRGVPPAAREDAWKGSFKSMRIKAFSLAADGFEVDVNKLPPSIFDDDRSSPGWTHSDEDEMAPVLAAHIPDDFSSYAAEDYYSAAAVPIAGEGTVIKEFQLPKPDKSMFHDSHVTHLRGEPARVWALDWHNHRMFQIEPTTGQVNPVPFPSDAKGPHTIVHDTSGNLWVTFQLSGKIGRYEPGTGTWKVFSVSAADTKDAVSMLGKASPDMVHSFANTAAQAIAVDSKGRIWATLSGVNQIASLDPATGRADRFDGPASPNAAIPYQGVMTSDLKHAWFTQFGAATLFSFNVETRQIEDVVRFPRGTGPRRIAITEKDVIYVPLFGAGQIVAYDTRTKRETARYDMPERACGPYTLAWDSPRQALWVPCANNSAVYQLAVPSGAITQYPLPRKASLIQAISVDPIDGDVYFTYSKAAVLDGPNMLVMIHPGDKKPQTQQMAATDRTD